MSKLAAIILAAGQASRFSAGAGDTKVLALLDGIPLIRHVAQAALRSQAWPIIIVTGHAGDEVEAALADLDLQFIRNHDPASGLSQSLKLGLDSLPDNLSGAIVLLADMPYVSAELIDRLLAAFEAAPTEPLAVVPVHAGRRGNPVLLGKAIFAAVKAIKGDRGARSVIEALEHGVIELLVEDPAVEIDIDTPEMLDHLRHGLTPAVHDVHSQAIEAHPFASIGKEPEGLSMMVSDADILRKAQEWKEAGCAVAIATVIETWGSAPRPVGSHLVIDAQGHFLGSVSGGCVEAEVATEALDVIEAGTPRLLEFGVADVTAWRAGLSCGGQISIYVERLD